MVKESDLINEVEDPGYYHFSDIEPIDVIESWSLEYHEGTVIKYISRAGRKGDPTVDRLKDLMKARWFLDRKIKLLSKDT